MGCYEGKMSRNEIGSWKENWVRPRRGNRAMWELEERNTLVRFYNSTHNVPPVETSQYRLASKAKIKCT